MPPSVRRGDAVPRVMPTLARIAAALFIVALPILLVTTNIRFLAGEIRLYEYGFREYDADQTTGLPLRDLDRAGREMIDYFENDEPTLRIIVQDDGDEGLLFSARETEHMEDVKALMRLVFRINEVALAYVLTYVVGIFVWARRPVRILAQQALAGLGVGLVVVLGVGAFAVTGFDAAWNRFHRVAFRNDLWQLDPDTDRLIQMFPERFWEDMTLLLGILTMAETLAIALLSLGYLGATWRRRPNNRRVAEATPPPTEVRAVRE